MQAIQTKYIGPSDSRGSRVKATADAGTITVSYDHALGIEGNHAAAAVALCRKLGWPGTLVGGGLKDNSYVFVFLNSDRIKI